ncbi:MAG: dockerin type I domain-containing protein [Deinococcota bacterium]
MNHQGVKGVRRGLAWLGLLVIVSLLVAVTYRVIEEDGPAGLTEAVAAAFAQWQDVEGAEFSLNENEDASNIIRYGDANLFGPDTVSLSVARNDSRGRNVIALIHPDKPAQRDRALLHETGILLGLRATADHDGVMNPFVAAGASSTLTEADRAAIAALGLFPAEDLNRDGSVNFYDLAEFAAQFDSTGVSLAADLNGDGQVDDADIAQLREAYVFSAPSETDPADVPQESGLPETDFPDLEADRAPDAPTLPDISNPDALQQGLSLLEDLLGPTIPEPDPFIGIGEVAEPPAEQTGLDVEGTPLDPDAGTSERLTSTLLELLLRLQGVR